MGHGAAGRTASALLVVWGLLTSALAVGCGAGPSRSQVITISTPASTLPPPASPTPDPVRIHVSGAVRHPNQVYVLPAGSIVQDAIKAAGGATSAADLERMNLALELADQQHVHVPRLGEENAPPVVSGGGAIEAKSGLININTATQAELETLPGIGETKAGRILAYREAHGPFVRVEDLENVPGIGPATLDGLRDLVTVE